MTNYATAHGLGSSSGESRQGARCSRCGTGNLPDARFCDKCGNRFNVSGQGGSGSGFVKEDLNRMGKQVFDRLDQARAKAGEAGKVAYGHITQTSQNAVYCLIAGIASWTMLPLVSAVLAVVFGGRARREIKESNGQLRGDTFVVIGMVMGGVQLGLAALGAIGVIIMLILRYVLPIIAREWLFG